MSATKRYLWLGLIALCLNAKAYAGCANVGTFGDGGKTVGCGQNIFLAQTGLCYSAHGQTNRRAGESALAAYSRACGYAKPYVLQAAQNAGWYNPARPASGTYVPFCGGARTDTYPATNYIKSQMNLSTANLVLRLTDDFNADTAVRNGCGQFQR